MANEMSFGHYRLLELLGRGGMGEVYRAFDPTMNRTVALKVLPPHLAGDPTFERRFRREAVAAAALNEPHIIPIHNSGEIDGRLYVDMRLVEGPELQDLLSGGPLAPARAVNIIGQIAGALDAAHAAGLIHRDVKPSNIMIGPNDFAYLIDFGIAQVLSESRITNVGETVGTFAYMAPERFDGLHATPLSDVYALTCVLYQCLTGEPPFASTSMEQVIAGHLTRRPPRPSAFGAPWAFDDVIARGLAKNPLDRYPTAGELAAAATAAWEAPLVSIDGRVAAEQQLSPWSADYTSAAPVTPWAPQPVPPGPPPNVRRRARRALRDRRVWLAVSALAVVAIATATTVALSGGDETTTSTRKTASLSASVLDQILLPVEELDAIVGVRDLRSPDVSTTLLSVPLPVDDQACRGVMSIADDAVYAGRGWRGTRVSVAETAADAGTAGGLRVSQSATAFESDSAAADFFSSSRADWTACPGQDISVDRDWETQHWRADAVSDASTSVIAQNVVLLRDTPGYTAGFACPHAMGIATNVIMEASVCGEDSGDEAVKIVQAMIANAAPNRRSG
jgi:hypothetical protein